MTCEGENCKNIHKGNGECCGEQEYREPTIVELNSCDPKTPYQHRQPVRVSCPNGRVLDCSIAFVDGESLRNVLRAVVALEPPTREGKGGHAKVFMTRFNNEIGKIVYEVADCYLGDAPGIAVSA